MGTETAERGRNGRKEDPGLWLEIPRMGGVGVSPGSMGSQVGASYSETQTERRGALLLWRQILHTSPDVLPHSRIRLAPSSPIFSTFRPEGTG